MDHPSDPDASPPLLEIPDSLPETLPETGGLAEEHRRLLDRSGIPLGFATDAGVRSVFEPADLKAVGAPEEFRRVMPGLLFRLPTVEGDVVWQIRPDAPPQDEDGRPRKYLLPSGCGSSLTIHDAMRPRLDDPETTRVVICEGTKQTLAVSAYAPPGTVVVGIQGCQNWRKDGIPLPGFSRLNLHGKTAIILFDGDRTTNANVWKASEELAIALRMHGADDVKFFPSIAEGSNGIDDVLGSKPEEERAPFLANALSVSGGIGRRPAKKRQTPRGPQLPVVDETENAIRMPPRVDPITGQSIPGDVILGASVRIITTIQIVDDLDPNSKPQLLHEIEVKVGSAGDPEDPPARHVLQVSDADLRDAAKWCQWLPVHMSSGMILPESPAAASKMVNAIRSHRSDETEFRVRLRRTGWYRARSGEWVYVHAGGSIGARSEAGEDVASEVDGVAGEIVFPDPHTDEDPAAAIQASFDVAEMLVDPSPWYALLGALAISHSGWHPPAMLMFHGRGGSGKSSILGTAAAHLIPTHSGGKASMATMNSTSNAILMAGAGVHNGLVVVDDYRLSSIPKEQERMDTALDQLSRLSYTGPSAARNRLVFSQARGVWAPAPAEHHDHMVVVSGEALPGAAEAESMLQRMLAIRIQAETSWKPGCASEAGAIGESGLYRRSMSQMIRWLARQIDAAGGVSEWVKVLDAGAERVSERITRDLGPHGTVRAREVTVPFLLGIEFWSQLAVSHKVMTAKEAQQWQERAEASIVQSMVNHLRDHLSGEAGGELPGQVALSELRAAVLSGRAHIGDGPASPGVVRLGKEVRARVGWDDVKLVAILPEVAASLLHMKRNRLVDIMAPLTVHAPDGSTLRVASVAGSAHRCLCVPSDQFFVVESTDG